MANRTSKSFRVTDGGRLVTVKSVENVGPANYMEKTNWRRVEDAEVRREGDTLEANIGSPVLAVFEAVRPNGDRAILACTSAAIFTVTNGTPVQVGSGYSATYWQGESLNGTLFLNSGVDLPQMFRVEWNEVRPVKELREVGVAACGTMCVNSGFLLFGDVTEIIDTELAGVMNGGSPYGLVASNKVNRIRFRIINSDFADGSNWAPLITGTIQSATKNKVTLQYPCSAFPVGAKVAVVGAGPNGGTLGGTLGYEDGVAVTNVNGAELTLALSADAGLVYPLTVQVTRWADVSSFVSRNDIQDDSSPIVRMMSLKQQIVVFRETGIFTGRYTADVDQPFIFAPAYRGPEIPKYPMAAIEVMGDYIVYPSNSRFLMFDGAGNPRAHDPLDQASTAFFTGSGLRQASHNQVTKEIWMHSPNGVLAFDYVNNTVSWINAPYSCGCFTQQGRFLIGHANAVYRYGLVDGGTPTYTRASGVDTTAVIRWGTLSASDLDEAVLINYTPLLSSAAPNTPLEVTLYGKDNPPQTFDELFTETLIDPTITPVIETFFQNVYFSDRICATTAAATALVGRSFTFRVVGSGGATRNYNGNS